MNIFRRKPRIDAKFVVVALDGFEHKAHLWPGDTFQINAREEGQPTLRITHKNGAWQIEQQAPFATLDRQTIEWAARQTCR
jgi:hypothetical protein